MINIPLHVQALYDNTFDKNTNNNVIDSNNNIIDSNNNIINSNNNVIDSNNNVIDSNNIEFMDHLMAHEINYYENFTVKQLKQILTFYISYVCKTDLIYNKNLLCKKKHQLINYIIDFESESRYYDIVIKRKLYWSYMNELQVDPFMRKYVTTFI